MTNVTTKSLQDISPLWQGKLLLYAVGLCLTLAMALLLIVQPMFLQRVDLLLYDLMVAGRAVPPQSTVPVLVGIDDESLATFGQWPWPRYRLAMLVEKLQSLGASVIVLDMLLPEPDRTSPEVIQIERQRDITGKPTPALPKDRDSNTQRLATALAQGKTVLGYYLDFSHPSPPARQLFLPAAPAGMQVISSTDSADHRHELKLMGIIRSLPALTEAASAEGFTNALEDVDGKLRRTPLLLPVDGKELSSLSLSALLLTSPQHILRLIKHNGETSLQWGNRTIPIDSAGNMLLDFRSGVHPYFSAQTILNGKVSPGSLQGKIALVGTWAKGLGDRHLTPSGELLNGLGVHATIIDNILAGTFIERPDWARGVELMTVLVAGIVCTLLLSQAGYLLSLLTLLVGMAGFYWGARQLLVMQGMHLSPFLPMMTLVVITSFLSLMKYGIEARKVHLRTQDLLEAQDEIIFSMSVMAEARDKDTGRHILRTQRYVEMLTRQLATTPKYSHLTASDIELFAKSAPLHDIGKVGIPDNILQKPGKLTEDEYAIMKTHTLIGAEALARIMVGSGHPEKQHFLDYAREMIETHHERWDGTGYPHGLRGEDIPLAGRLMALADVYDALISKRVYKKELTHAEVCDYIAQKSGEQFDPDIVAVFMAKNEDFLKVAQELADVTA